MIFDTTIKFIIKKAKDPGFRSGSAFIGTLVLFSFILKEFSQIRYDLSNRRNRSMELHQEDVERRKGFATRMDKAPNINILFEKMVGSKDLDNWENKRVNR